MMKPIYHFHDIARLPMPGDNVAVATRLLPAGTTFIYEDQQLTLDYTVMEGHRFAIKPIAKGEPLLSWELPFGAALEPISAGQYVINQGVLDELGGRLLDFDLPAKPNFREIDQTFVIDEDEFQPADPLPLSRDTHVYGVPAQWNTRSRHAQHDRSARHHFPHQQLCAAARPPIPGRHCGYGTY